MLTTREPPVYVQVKQRIEVLMKKKDLLNGNFIPSERKLADDMGVAPGTIRRALSEMVSEGKLVRLPRKGTMVSGSDHEKGKQKLLICVPKSDYFYPALIDVIERNSRVAGYDISLAFSRNDIDLEREIIVNAIVEGVAGIFLVPSLIDGQMDMGKRFDFLNGSAVPIVVLDHLGVDVKLIGVDVVLSDNFSGAYESTVHMIRHNYKKIAIAYGMHPKNLEFQQRLRGYRSALEDHGLSVPDLPILYSSSHIREPVDGLEMLKKYLDFGVDAFVTTQDITASFLMMRLASLGVKVGEDVGVIGFDDEPFCEFLSPQLSSVKVAKKEMAERAVAMIRRRIENKKRSEFRSIVLRPSVVARQSCGKRCPNRA